MTGNKYENVAAAPGDTFYTLRQYKIYKRTLVCYCVTICVLGLLLCYLSFWWHHNRNGFADDAFRRMAVIPNCSHTTPSPHAKYAIVVTTQCPNDRITSGVYKLMVRLKQYTRDDIWAQTDRYIQHLNGPADDAHYISGRLAGCTHVCHPQLLGYDKRGHAKEGWFARLNIWNMTHYDGVLYIDTEVVPVGDITALLVDGTAALKHAGKYLMWATTPRRQTHDSGVLLAQPNRRVYEELTLLGRKQLEKHPPYQDVLNIRFRPQANQSLPMDPMYNYIYHLEGSAALRTGRQVRMVHMIHPKPWNWITCNIVWFGASGLCEMWESTPTAM
jgi:hypothetical protein